MKQANWYLAGPAFSILNSVSPTASGPQTYAISGSPFSIWTQSPAASGPQTYAISGSPFSILNSVSPAAAGPQTYAISGAPLLDPERGLTGGTGPQTYAISGSPFSILNSVSPAASGPQTYAISGTPFSILNAASPVAAFGPQTYTINGLYFSILNGARTAWPSAPLRSYGAQPLLPGTDGSHISGGSSRSGGTENRRQTRLHGLGRRRNLRCR